MASDNDSAFRCWAVLELMGHRRLAGYVQETTIAGAGFLRIDVPGADGEPVTQVYSPASVYAITPCSQETARAVAASCRVEPVHAWELRIPELAATAQDPGPEFADPEREPDESRW